MKVKFKEWDCRVKGTNYLDNYARAIVLLEEKTNEIVAKATINKSDLLPPKDSVWIKDYSENEGITDTLIKAKIIEPDPTMTTTKDEVVIHSYKLTEAAIKNLWPKE